MLPLIKYEDENKTHKKLMILADNASSNKNEVESKYSSKMNNTGLQCLI